MRVQRTPSLRAPPHSPRDEGASATVVSGVVAFAVFLLAFMVLIDFAQHPVSTAKPDDAVLSALAHDALRVIGETPGSPGTWAATDQSVPGLERLGLVQQGKLRTLDPLKFDALAKGRTDSATADSKVDYEEARTALGLDGYDFHLRAYPVFQPFPMGSYGVTGMEDWRVAYVGHYNGNTEGAESVTESTALDDLPIAFRNQMNTGAPASGDKFRDTSQDLRQRLVPLLGALQDVSSLSGSLPDEQFRRMNASQLQAHGWPAPKEGNYALGIAAGADAPAYAKNTNMRGVLGYANLSAITNPRVSFHELVEGEGHNQSTSSCTLLGCAWTYSTSYEDYGIVEASLDGGSTWITLTPTTSVNASRMPSVYNGADASAPGANPTAWKRHTVDFSQCGACLGNPEVLLAVRWISDSDNTIGSTWLIDEFVVEDAVTGERVLKLTFEAPYYNGLIVGSNVAQSAMTPAELKHAVKDFVMQGGKVYVMGGQQNVQWLQPLFQVGIAGTTGQAFTPDTTHPLLTVPNDLDPHAYDNAGQAWKFGSKATDELFANVVQGGSPSEYVLAANNPNAFGDGQLILTTWQPHTMNGDDMRKWFANAIVYGKYHYLYMEVGPTVPKGVPVASATATALMDKTRDGSREFIEMALVLYVWQ